ncbi:glucose-6-phosphate-specific signal transduction histidine kinase [Paenibacillus endophyticus]|uniref:histidine kinase n=1 Tax=Paenibacillus endophyticus TaxID=1294268 RepID=A0A7W5CEG1_9BACL|nr:glucose-6-phosphate-specific signal transduction histidine kinase [Paenibacillus endophyticus]
MTKKIIDQGSMTLGFIGDYMHCKSFHERWIGFNLALKTSGIKPDDSYNITEADWLIADPKWLLCKEEKRGTITISVRRMADDLLIQVKDDGIGMPEKVLENFRRNLPVTHNSSETGGSGFGLRNVQERIRLHYGGNYNIVITSEIGVGTMIVLRIPAVLITEENQQEIDI